MLLLDVQVEIAEEKEALLNEWYYLHVPRLASVPGYESGRRYVSLTPGPRYLALYEIRNHAALPSLLGDDHAKRHPLTLSEWARWDRDLAPHMSHCRTNLYEPVFGASAPILSGDHALTLVRFDLGDDAADVVSALGEVIGDFVAEEADSRRVLLLKAANDPAIAWLKTAPDHLLIIECAGNRAARDFVKGVAARSLLHRVSALAKATPHAGAYAPIARHWSWTREI